MAPLLTALTLGLASAGFALLFRALPWPASWLRSKHWAMQKLFYCASCAGGRAALVIVGVVYWHDAPFASLTDLVLFYFAATGIGAWIFNAVYPPAIELPGEGE